MRRPATLLLLLALPVLLALLAIPALGQDAASTEPTASSLPQASSTPQASLTAPATTAPMPTPIPAAAGPVVQGVLYFSPTCGHCHYVITEVLPGLFEANGGEFLVSYDESVSAEPSFYLMSNGRLQLLMVDVSQPDGQTMYLADAEALGFEETPGVPLLQIADEWYLGWPCRRGHRLATGAWHRRCHRPLPGRRQRGRRGAWR
jgi:hypothetical protein